MTVDGGALPGSSAESRESESAVSAGDIWQDSRGSTCHAAAPPGAAQPPGVPGAAGLSAEAIRALPAAFPFDPIVPAAFGISRSAAYRALTAGQLPIRALRLGRKLIVTRADLMAALGIPETPPSQAAVDDGQTPSRQSALDRVHDNSKEGER